MWSKSTPALSFAISSALSSEIGRSPRFRASRACSRPRGTGPRLPLTAERGGGNEAQGTTGAGGWIRSGPSLQAFLSNPDLPWAGWTTRAQGSRWSFTDSIADQGAMGTGSSEWLGRKGMLRRTGGRQVQNSDPHFLAGKAVDDRGNRIETEANRGLRADGRGRYYVSRPVCQGRQNHEGGASPGRRRLEIESQGRRGGGWTPASSGSNRQGTGMALHQPKGELPGRVKRFFAKRAAPERRRRWPTLRRRPSSAVVPI